MEDARFEWLRERVYHGLKLDQNEIFEKLLEDDKNDDLIRKFILDTATDETAYAILFYVDHVEKVRDIEVFIKPFFGIKTFFLKITFRGKMHFSSKGLFYPPYFFKSGICHSYPRKP